MSKKIWTDEDTYIKALRDALKKREASTLKEFITKWHINHELKMPGNIPPKKRCGVYVPKTGKRKIQPK